MFESEISCLLGTNGAGKSTLLSILTGMAAASSGIVSIYGMDVIESMNEIRKILGVCFQYDILWGSLSVRRHLEIYGRFKGLPRGTSAASIKEVLISLGIYGKIKCAASTLSGGMKRRLCTALAFLGNSKLVLLDEPTSGLDPFSRRSVWEILKKLKDGRIICLSSHFIDEVEILADRVSIISLGKLRAFGSPLFLKDQLGCGIRIEICMLEDDTSRNQIVSLVQSIAPSCAVDCLSGKKQISLDIGKEDISKLGEISTLIDSARNSLRIEGYSLSATSLEDVFMKIADFEVSKSEASAGRWENIACKEKQFYGNFSRQVTSCFSVKFKKLVRNASEIFGSLLLPAVLTSLEVFFMKELKENGIHNVIEEFCKTKPGMARRCLSLSRSQRFDFLSKNAQTRTHFLESVQKSKMGTAFGTLCTLFAFLCLSPSTCASETADSRNSPWRQHQVISGLKISSFWVSSFLADSMILFISLVPSFAIVAWFLWEDNLILLGFSLDLFFACLWISMQSSLSYSYLYTLAFEKLSGLFSLSLQFVGALISVGLLTAFPEPWNWILSSIACPPVGAMHFLTPKFSQSIYENAKISEIEMERRAALPSVPFHLFYLIVLISISIILSFAVLVDMKKERDRARRGITKWSSDEDNKNLLFQFVSDPSVLEEERRMAEGAIGAIPSLVLNNVKVEMKKKVKAVCGVSLACQEGEIFGLLGLNGAGKSTLMKICSGQLVPSCGAVSILGHNPHSSIGKRKCRSLVGYCPQEDPLLPELTVKEHLTFYGVLRGLPPESIKGEVDWLISMLNLTRFTNMRAMHLSGGNKRKLCAGMALIGGPSLILLDEPSSGMDPAAKRHLWRTIEEFSKCEGRKRTFIVTTHSMEEAEALSTRLAIMSNGRFRCLGSLQEVKHRYGKGYELSIRVSIKHEFVRAINEILRLRGLYDNETEKMSEIRIPRTIIDEVCLGQSSERAANYAKTHGSAESSDRQCFCDWWAERESVSQLISWMNSICNDMPSVIEESNSFVKFAFADQTDLIKTIVLLEENKSDLGVMYFSLSQTSLEHIFNVFAKEAQEFDCHTVLDEEAATTGRRI